MFGIYIHWPFCLSKCIYCDFGSNILSKKEPELFVLQNKYCEFCKKQLLYFSKNIQNNKYQKVTSIYFGGGTPSLLRPENISCIIQEVNNLFCVEQNCEITLEANPTSFEVEKFYQFRDSGINRLSLGVQSFDDNELSWLGRTHSAKQAIEAIEAIKKIFLNYNFDLIYCLPKQSIDKWINELMFALSLEPNHLSLYTLIIDKSTPLGKLVASGGVVPKTDDETAMFYDMTNDFIKKTKNIKQYEVSNYAVCGFESVHNCCYWNSYDYIGVGSMAHGRLRYKDGNRYETLCIKNVNEWFESFNKKGNGLQIERKLQQKEQAEEILLMGLRTYNGINIKDIKDRFKFDLTKYLDCKNIIELEKRGFLSFKDDVLKLTYSGLKVLNAVLEKILI